MAKNNAMRLICAAVISWLPLETLLCKLYFNVQFAKFAYDVLSQLRIYVSQNIVIKRNSERAALLIAIFNLKL